MKCIKFFLPSYYINPHYVMAYNCHSLMFLYDMKREDPYSKNHRQKLSSKLKILRLLISQPTYGKLLSDRLHLTIATISHHLDVLSSAHLITESREKIRNISVQMKKRLTDLFLN